MNPKRKKVLFIGDSITEGISGISFVDLLKEEFENYELVNKGLGGDTLEGITKRLSKEIEIASYDIIVLEAGHNDIIIPALKDMGILFGMMERRLIKRGSYPTTEPSDFSKVFDSALDKLHGLSESKIIITTLSCIGENLESSLNKKRAVLNEIIRKAAKNHGCLIADVAKEFDSILSNNSNSEYFLGNFLDLMVFDPVYSKTAEDAQKLSARRNTKLTIDGVHLNYEGAKIYKEVIGKSLE